MRFSLAALPYAFVAALGLYPSAAFGQQLQYKTVWYHAYDAGQMNLLGDDTVYANESLSPRAIQIQSIDQNFNAIATLLGANAVIVRCVDEGDYPGEGGGGFPYNPGSQNDRKPQLAVAQEIILDLAQAHGLKVFFTVEPSQYHKFVTDREPSIHATDSLNFISSIINPTLYYSTSEKICTTHLENVGLANTCIGDYHADPRVAGFILGGEIIASVDPVGSAAWFDKYWSFFYSSVHPASPNPQLACLYVNGGPGFPSGIPYEYGSIKSLKSYFGTHPAVPKPDLFGVEWYGPSEFNIPGQVAQRYDAAKIGDDVQAILQALNEIDTSTNPQGTLNYPGDYSIPSTKVWLAEGGTNGVDRSSMPEYFSKAIYTAAHAGVPFISVWASDSYWPSWEDNRPSTLPAPSLPVQSFLKQANNNEFDLFSTSIANERILQSPYLSSPEGYYIEDASICTDCGPLGCYFSPKGWNNRHGQANAANHITYPLAYATFSYTGLTAQGRAVSDAFASAGDAIFYSLPARGTSRREQIRLFWKTELTSSVDIHAESPSGSVVARNRAANSNAAVPIARAKATRYFLTDHLNPQKVLATTAIMPDSSEPAYNEFYSSPKRVCGGTTGLASATLHWSTQATDEVEIHIDAPTGTLFIRGGPSGSATTGDWISSGMTFYLVDGHHPQTILNALVVIVDSSSE